MPTLTDTQIDAIRTARETAASAEQELRRRAADGAKARPTVVEINRTLDRLASVQTLLAIALEPNAEPPSPAETAARALGWRTNIEAHGIDDHGVVHLAGFWAPDWTAAVAFKPHPGHAHLYPGDPQPAPPMR